MGIGSQEGSPAPVTETVTQGVEATEAAVETVAKSEVSTVESELRAKITALEEKLASLTAAISNGLHNRVNEIEQTIKRKFPYG